jgi:uncharacterized protein YbjT (DUF2867 family)
VLARTPAKLPADLQGRIEVVAGSMLDVEAFTQALQGCDTFYFCIPQADDASDVGEHYATFAQNAATAAQQAGTRRVVYLSGAGKDSPLAQRAGSASALFSAEDILVASGLALRALRCPVFYESTLWQIEPIVHAHMMFGLLPGDYRHEQVAVRDIANTAVALLSDPAWTDQRGIGVFGPTSISQDEIAAWISQAINMPIRYQQISREQYVGNLLQFGVSDALAYAVADMFEAIASGLFDSEPHPPSAIPPMAMPDWIHDVFVPAFRLADPR